MIEPGDTRLQQPRDTEFGSDLRNADNNIENLRRSDETWKVQLRGSIHVVDVYQSRLIATMANNAMPYLKTNHLPLRNIDLEIPR
ncbi:MAG: hypothetical protein IPH64_09645 [Comamonadaceae bacterium]|nr:hypothetical protein [Comamonadaceae bacterium]